MFFTALELSNSIALARSSRAGRQLGVTPLPCMYIKGRGVAVDYKQAVAWFEKAAAQDQPNAVGQLGLMYKQGKGVTPSWRRARELYQRAIELGSSTAVKNMQILTGNILVS